MNQIATYSFNQSPIRTLTIESNPWFALIDCMKALGIKHKSTKIRLNENGVRKTYLTDNMGREQETSLINEPNLYRLIFRSNKPQAQAFADWVYEEVLPSIRKTGGYGNTPALSSYDLSLVGGTVKRCVKSAIRELLEDKGNDSWEVSDNDLLNCLYRWSATKHRGTTQTIREINAENTRMKEQLAYIQKAFK